MTRLEDQLKQLADTPALRPRLPLEDLTRRSSQLTKRRKRLSTAGVVFVAIVVFLVPLPQLHLLHSTGPQPAGHGNTPTIGKQLAELGSNSSAGVSFGYAMASSGDTAVIGSDVFTKTAAGWKQTGELTSSDNDPQGCFGVANAISGSTIVVSDACYSYSSGRDYVFTKTAAGWKQTAVLKGSDIVGGDKFGFPVAISGTTIVVGAFQHADFAGRAYVFTKTPTGWRQTAELKGSDTVALDSFGISVAISGSTIVVGATGHAADAGRAYVFTKTPTGWRQTTELKGSDTVAGDAFGTSLTISASTIVVGASGHSNDVGRAYVFTQTPTGWPQTAELKGSNTKDYFGFSVAISDGIAVVGAPASNSEGSVPPGTGPGRAYLFTDSAAGWKQTAELKGSDIVGGDEFGWSMVLTGNTALVSAPDHANVGRVYVFEA